MTGSPARSRRRWASARARRAGSSSPPDGRFAYTGNATGSISGFAIERDGSLRALNADGLTALAPRPNDLAIAGEHAVRGQPGDAGGHRVPDARRRQPRGAAAARAARHHRSRVWPRAERIGGGRLQAGPHYAWRTMTVAASILLAALVGGVVFVLLDSWQRRADAAAPAAPSRCPAGLDAGAAHRAAVDAAAAAALGRARRRDPPAAGPLVRLGPLGSLKLHSRSRCQAPAIAPTWRWSVPQQPPSTLSRGRRSAQRGVALAEVARIALVELGRLVELRVAARRGVRAQAADPLQPRLAAREHVLEVRRVRAVDHVVRGPGAGLVVDLLDRVARAPRRSAAARRSRA